MALGAELEGSGFGERCYILLDGHPLVHDFIQFRDPAHSLTVCSVEETDVQSTCPASPQGQLAVAIWVSTVRGYLLSLSSFFNSFPTGLGR